METAIVNDVLVKKSQELALQEKIENWLESNCFKMLKMQIDDPIFLENLVIVIPINPIEIMEKEVSVGTWLIKNFGHPVINQFKIACLRFIQKEFPDISNFILNPKQLQVHLRLTCLPFSSLHFHSDYSSLSLNKTNPDFPLISLKGIVYQVYLPEIRLRSKTFKCKKCEVAFAITYNNKNNMDEIRCNSCGVEISELIHQRLFNRVQQIVLFDGKGVSRKCLLQVELLDDLVGRVNIGDQIAVCGLLKKRLEPMKGESELQFVQIIFQANNIFRVTNIGERLSEPNRISLLPKNSPWIFTEYLTENFGSPSILPLNLFFNFRLALLLSIVSGKENISENKSCINLCVISPDAFGRRLVNFASQFYERVTIHGEGPLAPKLSSQNGTLIQHAGHFFIAGNGLLIIPEIVYLNKSDLSFLGKALEKECITLTDGVQKVFEFTPPDTTVIALSHYQKDLKPFAAKGFDLVFVLDLSPEEEISLVNFSLNQASSSLFFKEDINITEEEFKIYLTISRNLSPPKLTEEASSLLQKYWLGWRRVQGCEAQILDMTLKTMQTLILLSEAHARLLHKSCIEIEDALIAIMLVEESFLTVYNRSVLGFQLRHPMGKRNIDIYGATPQERFSQFYQHILRFCEIHVGEE